MSKSVRKTIRECEGDICECLYKRIEQLAFASSKKEGNGTQGLFQRFKQQVAKGAQGPGTTSWLNHEKAIQEQKAALQAHLKEYDKQGCGNGHPIMIKHARDLAIRQAPTATEWEANNSGFSTGEVVAGATIGATALYVGYRTLRMIPSLFPAFWWSIPYNSSLP